MKFEYWEVNTWFSREWKEFIYIHFALEKGTGKIVILKKHAETLCSLGKWLFFDSISKSFSKTPLLPFLKKIHIVLYDFISFYIILYHFMNCPVFKDIKQTLHYKVALG